VTTEGSQIALSGPKSAPAAGALLGPESALLGPESALLGPESALLGPESAPRTHCYTGVQDDRARASCCSNHPTSPACSRWRCGRGSESGPSMLGHARSASERSASKA